ncbi:MAG TPA: undecaprenyl-diphosphate phosphatase [Clostridiales bacterium]|nr:undecaprenyl-diphosphate phosphatase [Clostridiales bacterium]
MTLLKAIIMGIIQGIAEFLPISSSGHLAIMKHILKIELETGLLFDVLLHIGTLVAIFIAFWKDIKKLIIEGFSIVGDFFINIFIAIKNLFIKDKTIYKKMVTTPYRRFVMLVIVSTIPTGIIGYSFKNIIVNASETLIVPGIFLIITGALMLVADNVKLGSKDESNTSYLDAIIVGVSQGLATMPGLSRSGSTITSGLLCGFDKMFAVKYSFIMSIPAIIGAALLEVKDITNSSITSNEAMYYFIGMVISAVVGYICIKTMLVVVRGKKFKYFAYYCFAVGSIAIIANFII